MRSAATLSLVLLAGCLADDVPRELTDFEPTGATVFQGDLTSWDAFLAERGWILREDAGWSYWYTATDAYGQFKLGYASSPDGLSWTRWPQNPVWQVRQIQDCMVVRDGDLYRLIAEAPEIDGPGLGEMPQVLTSTDRVTWQDGGKIDLRRTDGTPVVRGEYGTPSVIEEDGAWWMFYENDDSAIYVAKSTDFHTFVNVQDEPVITLGPLQTDDLQMALNQVIKYQGRYYAYYSGLGHRPEWTVNVAVSDDLVHWRKWSGNPVLPAADNETSGYVVFDGARFRLYTVNTQVKVHFAR